MTKFETTSIENQPKENLKIYHLTNKAGEVFIYDERTMPKSARGLKTMDVDNAKVVIRSLIAILKEHGIDWYS